MRHATEIAAGERFEFGRNWANFLQNVNEERIMQAEKSLKDMLGEDISGKTFLDAGSGSGLFSLAARRLGAKVHSFDYDPQSVACTKVLKEQYFPGDANWVVEEGSVLDDSYIGGLGSFDVVYSWGVLHHTGSMWQALNNVIPLVADRGKLYIAIYNTSAYSRRWMSIKRVYCSLPSILQPAFAGLVVFPIQLKEVANAAIRLKLGGYLSYIRSYKVKRGMSWWHDQLDWLGGYPYETATPDEIFNFYKENGFFMEKLSTCVCGTGGNDYMFSNTNKQNDMPV